MSDLAKKALMKGKPPMAVPKNLAESDDDEEEAKDVFEAETKMPPIGLTVNPTSSLSGSGINPPLPKSKPQVDFSPLNWKDFFDKQEFLDDGTPLYIAGGELGPVFICLHGAGHSAQSFACLAGQLKKFATVVAFDFRGHGDSKFEKDINNLNIDTLIQDSLKVFDHVDKLFPNHTIVIIGHSMGGAVATRATEIALSSESLAKRIFGLIVIDVVEGTALEALPFMENIVKNRPAIFKDPQSAIQWAYRSGTVKDVTSARVSIPPQLLQRENKEKGVTEYVWKVDLMASQEHWVGWFKGLTPSFLNVRVPKILLLAGAERMDKELTIAHMQGRFRLKVVYDVGHSVQEDNWKETAKICYEFLYNFRIPITAQEVEVINTKGVGAFHPSLPQNPFE